MSRINNSHSCFVCSRRTDGLAVGRPEKLAWYCNDCGPELARKALYMKNRDFDSLEKLVAVKVAEEAGVDPITIDPSELPSFIAWAVKAFADTMRVHLDEGNAPF